jgi:hypothetical protein
VRLSASAALLKLRRAAGAAQRREHRRNRAVSVARTRGVWLRPVRHAAAAAAAPCPHHIDENPRPPSPPDTHVGTTPLLATLPALLLQHLPPRATASPLLPLLPG